MIAAVDILDEVEADVTALNGEIVRRAFRGHCCGYVDNQEEFEWLLLQYRTLRLEHHRLQIHRRRTEGHEGIGPLNYNYLFYELSEKINDNVTSAMSLRWQLKKIWPCAACIHLYNPTHKTRRFPQLW